MKPPKIAVVGSLNMDLITATEKMPGVGETILGQAFSTAPGGKGANQAVAAAKLGAQVAMVGCVGDDPYGKVLLKNLQEQGVDFVNQVPVSNVSTGIAQITVSAGDNRIIVVPGANHDLTPDIVEQYEDIIADSDVLLTQLEIPFETVETAIELAGKHGVQLILNPAPAQVLSETLLEKVDVLTPNEHEFKQMFKHEPPENLDIVMTRGEKGSDYLRNHGRSHVPGLQVDALDTTGAGDAFNGGLAFALGSGQSMVEACRFTNAVAALAVTKSGAQGGMPTFEEVNDLLSLN